MKKESANPFSKLLISLKSITDPSKEDVSIIKDLISDAIGVLDSSLYLAAVGEEKEIKVIGQNIIVFKRALRSIAWTISNSVAVKLSSSYNEELPAVSTQSEVSKEKDVTENFLVGVVTPDDLEGKLKEFQQDCEILVTKCRALQKVVLATFNMLEERQNIIIELERPTTLTEIIRRIKERCNIIISNIEIIPIQTVISSEHSIMGLIKVMLEKKISIENFNSYKEAYIKMKKQYSRLLYKYNEVLKDYTSVSQGITNNLGASENQQSDNIVEPDKSKKLNPIKIQDEKEPTVATIIFTDKYDPIKKEAIDPGILQKLHTGLSEVGQDVVSPFSDTIKRRIKIRNSIKKIKKEAIDFLIEIRKTTGKKASINENISRWNIIIDSYNKIGKMLNEQLGLVLSVQLSLADADLYGEKIRDSKTTLVSDYHKKMYSFMDGFEEPIPELPKMEMLIAAVKKGSPWGKKKQRLFSPELN